MSNLYLYRFVQTAVLAMDQRLGDEDLEKLESIAPTQEEVGALNRELAREPSTRFTGMRSATPMKACGKRRRVLIPACPTLTLWGGSAALVHRTGTNATQYLFCHVCLHAKRLVSHW